MGSLDTAPSPCPGKRMVKRGCRFRDMARVVADVISPIVRKSPHKTLAVCPQIAAWNSSDVRRSPHRNKTWGGMRTQPTVHLK